MPNWKRIIDLVETAVAPTLESLGIDKLSVDERLDLIDKIWDSLPAGAADIPEWHVELLKKRLAAAEAHPDAGIPWREVLDSLGS